MKRSLRVGSAPIFFFSVPAEKIFYVYAETQTGERRLEPSFFFLYAIKKRAVRREPHGFDRKKILGCFKRGKAFFGKVPHKSRKMPSFAGAR